MKTWKLALRHLFSSTSIWVYKSQLWSYSFFWYNEETLNVCQSTVIATSISLWLVWWRHCLIIEPLLIVWIYRLISLSWHIYHWKTTENRKLEQWGGNFLPNCFRHRKRSIYVPQNIFPHRVMWTIEKLWKLVLVPRIKN